MAQSMKGHAVRLKRDPARIGVAIEQNGRRVVVTFTDNHVSSHDISLLEIVTARVHWVPVQEASR